MSRTLREQRSLKPNPRTAPVGVEALDATELLDGLHAFRERGAVEADDARAALEHVTHQAGETFSRTARGQRVARSGDEIARGDGRPAAEENRAARADVARTRKVAAIGAFMLLALLNLRVTIEPYFD